MSFSKSLKWYLSGIWIHHVCICFCIKPMWHHDLYSLYQAVTYPHWFPDHVKKEVKPPPATDAGVTDLESKKVSPPPGTRAEQGTRACAVKMEVCPPPAAGPLVPDLEQMKRKATDELDRDRTWVIFSNPLTITCLSIVQKQMHYLLMLALYLSEA